MLPTLKHHSSHLDWIAKKVENSDMTTEEIEKYPDLTDQQKIGLSHIQSDVLRGLVLEVLREKRLGDVKEILTIDVMEAKRRLAERNKPSGK